mgnify:CR=1 FL=1
MNDGASSPITAETASDPIVFLSDVGQTNGNSAFVTKGGYLAASFSLEANTVITGFDFPIVSLSGPISRIAWSFVDSQLNQVFASGSADVIATSVPASPYLYIYNEYNISANIPLAARRTECREESTLYFGKWLVYCWNMDLCTPDPLPCQNTEPDLS